MDSLLRLRRRVSTVILQKVSGMDVKVNKLYEDKVGYMLDVLVQHQIHMNNILDQGWINWREEHELNELNKLH